MTQERENQKTLFDSDDCIKPRENLRLNKEKITDYLNSVLLIEETSGIRRKILNIKLELSNLSENFYINDMEELGENEAEIEWVLRDLDQIIDSYTAERMKYYINRLIKSLKEVRFGRINDINLNRWKEYDNILSDSLWLFDRRDTSGEHVGWYWGNFIPQIPNQLLLRYSKRGDWIFDPFVGSGTTLIECKRLGRNGIGIELNDEVAQKAKERVEKERNEENVVTNIVLGDSAEVDYNSLLLQTGVKSVQLVVMHPPYFDIIKFSDNGGDLSNATSVDDFLHKLEVIVKKCRDILDKGRYLAIVIGDKYEAGHWIPLGFYSMQVILKSGFSLKSIVVKNFDETKGKRNQKELWRYRALLGEYYVFKHEYIFIFIKE